MTWMERSSGPDCPKCGCNRTELVNAGTRFGRPWARYQCDACQALFSAGSDPNADGRVDFHVLRCPTCNSDNTRVTTTRKPIRYHKCDDCDGTFSSKEV